MTTNLSVLFYLKKAKSSNPENVPVYVRITVNGQRAELASGETIDPSKWNARAGRAKGSKEDIRTFNNALDRLQLKINDTVRYLQDRNVDVSDICYTLFRGKLTTCFAGKEMQLML